MNIYDERGLAAIIVVGRHELAGELLLAAEGGDGRRRLNDGCGLAGVGHLFQINTEKVKKIIELLAMLHHNYLFKNKFS